MSVVLGQIAVLSHRSDTLAGGAAMRSAARAQMHRQASFHGLILRLRHV